MMKLKNSIGIFTLLAAISLVCLAFIMMSQSVEISASLVQLSMLNFTVLIALTGLFITKKYSEPQPMVKKGLTIFALILCIFGGLVSFNILDVQVFWNVLIALAVAFITLVQMQVLNWSASKQLRKVLGLLTLVSNIFIFTFFIFKLTSPTAGFILDIAVLTSLISFLLGLVLMKKVSPQKA